MGSSIFSIIAGISIIQYIILSIFILRKKNGNQNANVILFIFLLINCIITYAFFSYSSGLYKYISPLIWVELPFYYLFFPVFFLYIKALTTFNFKFKKRDLLHFILFFIIYITKLRFMIWNKDQKIINISFTYNYNMNILEIIEVCTVLVQNTFYIIWSIIIIRNYNNKIKNNYSNISKINLSWIVYLVLLAFIIQIILVVSFTFVFLFYRKYHHILQIITVINMLIVIAISYKGLFQPEIFHGINPVKPMKNNNTTSLSEDFMKIYIKKLEKIMEEKKLFLNPDLNLYDLSKEISLKRNNLSIIINKHYKCNFYDFLNKYRIQEVKHYLSDPKNQKKSILTIAYDAGFNNKSTFNRIFKKYTNLSPTEYRKKLNFNL